MIARVLHFFSLSVLTQIILMLGQLVLLPLQLRLWGQATTAVWYAALATATLTYAADCGLRTAGHAELIRACENPSAGSPDALSFREIWSWIRLIVFILSAALIVIDAAAHFSSTTRSYGIWRALLIAGCALESMLIIRIIFLDTLGRYRAAEASYLSFATLRLAASLPALWIFHWNVPGLAAIYFVTAAIALLSQEIFLCRGLPLLRLTGPFPPLAWRTLALARYTIAEPLATWTRLSLPVLVIGAIASPVAVTTYVALRSVFGVGRTTIQQLARVASVEYLAFTRQGRARQAHSLFKLFVICAVFFGVILGAFVLLDNLRLIGLWLKHSDRGLFQQIALAFAVTAPFFAYQIPMSLLFRTGRLAIVARRHYAYAAYSSLFAVSMLYVRHLPLYLILLTAAELTLSIEFFASRTEPRLGRSPLILTTAASAFLCLAWTLIRRAPATLVTQFSPHSLLLSGAVLLLIAALIAAVLFVTFRPDIRSLRTSGAVAK